MRTEYKIIALSVLVALLGWTVDAVLDSYFHAAPFWQSLFLDPHAHELVLRLTLVASVIALGATMSITFAERKRAEEALRTAAQSRLNQVLAVTPAAIYTCEAGGRYGATFISGNVKLQVGYEPQEFVEDPEFWADHIHPEDAPRIFQALPNLFKKGHHRHEYRFLHKDGTYRWMLDEMRLVCDADGNPLEIIGYWADITERKLAEEELERHRHHLKELVEERTAELKAANEQLQQEIADRERAEEALKESEARFRHWVNHAADESYLVDFDGTIVDVNQTACDKLGYTKQELLKLNLADIDIDVIPGKHAEKWKEVLTGERITVSGVRRRKDGTTYPVEVRVGLIESGGRGLMLGLARDISERKRAEEALRASQEMLRLVMDSIPQAIFWKDRDSVYLGCNGNFARDAGLDEPAQIVGLTDYDLPWKPEETDFFRAVDRRVMGRGQAEFNIVEPLRTADGRQVWVETNKIPLRDAEGRVVGILGTYADISERKRAEEALRQSEERFRNLVETTSDWVWEVDKNAVYTYASPKIRDILGYEPEEVLGRTPFDLMPPEEARRIADAFAPIAASRRPFASLENRNLHRDGHLVVLETSGVPLFYANGTFRGYRGIDRDITERKRAEEALRIKDNAIASSISAIAIADPEDRLTYVNDSFLRLWGYTGANEVLGKSNLEFWRQPEEAAKVIEALREKGSWVGELVARRKDGSDFDVQLLASMVMDQAGNPICLMASFIDITERKEAEEALRASERRLVAENADLSRLHEMSMRLMGQEDYLTLLQAVLDAAIDLTGAQKGNLQLYDPASRSLKIVSHRGLEQPFLDHFAVVDCGQAVCGEAMRRGGRVIIEDVAQSPIFVGTAEMPVMEAAGVRAVQSTPMWSRNGTLLGMVSTHFTQPHRPNERTLRLLDLCVRQAADLVERKQAEDTLRAERRRLFSVLETLPAFVYLQAPDYSIRFANRAFRERFGDPSGRPCHEIVWGFGEPCEECPTFSPEYPQAWERTHPADGRTYIIYDNPFIDVDGSPLVLKVAVDITERKRAEAALRRSEERYALAQRAANIGSWDWDIVTGALAWSEAIEPMFGFAPGRFGATYEAFLDCVHPEDRQFVIDSVDACVERGTDYDIEHRIVWPDGTVRWVSETGDVIRDGGGQAVRMLGVVQDITERKQAESKLEHARRRIEELAYQEQERANWLAGVLDQVPTGVYIARAPDVKIVLGNKAAAQLCGLPLQDVEAEEVGKHLRLFSPKGEPLPAQEWPLSRAVLRGEYVDKEHLVVVRPDGSRVNLLLNAAPLLEDGQVVGGLVAFWDVTAEKEAQRQLEEASRLKDEFLSMASHELKTPIASIKIFSELAVRRPDAMQPKLMETLLRQADQLTALINDLLDVARLQLGRMPMEMKQLDLAALLSELCERRRPLFGGRLVSCPHPREAVVEGDALRLEQVFTNLLDNAAKYSPENSQINVRLGHRDGNAVVEVEDKGVGIPPEHLPHIFERFYKPGPQQAVYPGLGVGLYITKRIVERHGGRIWAESEGEGKGSRFFVELPLAEPGV